MQVKSFSTAQAEASQTFLMHFCFGDFLLRDQHRFIINFGRFAGWLDLALISTFLLLREGEYFRCRLFFNLDQLPAQEEF